MSTPPQPQDRGSAATTASRAPLLTALRGHIQALQAGMADHECGECQEHANEAWRALDVLEKRGAEFAQVSREYVTGTAEEHNLRATRAALIDALAYIERGGPTDDIPFCGHGFLPGNCPAPDCLHRREVKSALLGLAGSMVAAEDQAEAMSDLELGECLLGINGKRWTTIEIHEAGRRLSGR